MKIEFTKMHGAGNDYVYVDCTKEDLPNPGAISEYVSHRRFGVGSDGLMLRISKCVSSTLTNPKAKCAVMVFVA